jgi:hypothetical protein
MFRLPEQWLKRYQHIAGPENSGLERPEPVEAPATNTVVIGSLTLRIPGACEVVLCDDGSIAVGEAVTGPVSTNGQHALFAFTTGEFDMLVFIKSNAGHHPAYPRRTSMHSLTAFQCSDKIDCVENPPFRDGKVAFPIHTSRDTRLEIKFSHA